MTRTTLTALAAALLLAGCGDEGPTSPSDPTTATTAPAPTTATRPGPQQVADRAVLTVADLPQGWAAGSTGRSDTVACPAVTRARRTALARAASPEFVLNADNSARGVVFVYDSEKQAVEAYASLVADRTRACLTEAFDELMFAHMDRRPSHEEIHFSTPATEELGDENVTYRWTSVIPGADFDATFAAELAIVRDGRALALVTLYHAFNRIDAASRARVVAAAADRLHEQVGG